MNGTASGDGSGKLWIPRKMFFLKAAAKVVIGFNNMTEKNGLSYARKSMMVEDFLLSPGCVSTKTQLTNEL